jgi:hypothetical protein
MIRDLRTILDYDKEIEKLENERYLLMLKKFPIGCEVEYYRKEVLERGVVKRHAKHTCSLHVQPPGKPGAWLYWVAAIKCEPENPIEIRTINCGYEKGEKGCKSN